MAAKKKPIVRFDTVPIEKREMLRAEEAASLFFGVSRSTWYAWFRDGWLPKPVQILGHKNRWRTAELRDWCCAGCPPASSWRWTPTQLGSYESLILDAQGRFEDLSDEINQLSERKEALNVEITSLNESKKHAILMARLQR